MKWNNGKTWVVGLVLFWLVVFAANINLVLMSMGSQPVLEHEDYYEKGIAYDSVIDARSAGRSAGMRISRLKNGSWKLQLKDSVAGSGFVEFKRMAVRGMDQKVPLHSSKNGRQWVTPFVKLKEGLWKVEVLVEPLSGEPLLLVRTMSL